MYDYMHNVITAETDWSMIKSLDSVVELLQFWFHDELI